MLTIGQAASRTGLSASAIRYYERRVLIRPSRLLNGYRRYDEKTIKELRFVRRAQALGITLKEIKLLLQLARDGERPCMRVRELARRNLNEIDARISELELLRRELCKLLARPTGSRSNELCPLIPSRQ